MSLPTTPSDQPDSRHHVFRPERTHILGAAMMLGISLLVIGAKPVALFWLPILPAGLIFWMVRAHTTVDDAGVQAHYAVKKSVFVPWEDIAGIGFERSRAFVRTRDNRDVKLPGVTFNSLPELELASAGRIPDALTQARTAANDSVVVVNKNGRHVLMSAEEYQQYQAQQQATPDNEQATPDNDDRND